MQEELSSLMKQEVFRLVVQTPKGVKSVRYKRVIVGKRNENNEIIKYKKQLVAHGFSHRLGIDYKETYSYAMDAVTFCFLISFVVSKRLDMCLMDVFTAYIYGSIDNDIYVKILK